MTDRIDEIRARCEAATAGKWKTIERGNSVPSHSIVMVAYADLPQLNVCAGISPLTHNAEFISHARDDIPYLLDRLAKAERQIASAAEDMAELADVMDREDLRSYCDYCYWHGNERCNSFNFKAPFCFEWRGTDYSEEVK